MKVSPVVEAALVEVLPGSLGESIGDNGRDLASLVWLKNRIGSVNGKSRMKNRLQL